MATLAILAGGGRLSDAQSYDVCPSGCRHTSVQTAINAASPGATVRVGPGVYRETLRLKAGVQVVGAGPDQTIVQGNGSATVVTASGSQIGRNTLLEGMTITGGGGRFGGGIQVSSGAAPTLRRLWVVDNAAVGGPSGGGILVSDGAHPLLEEVKLQGNRANSGSAISVWQAQATLRRCTVVENGDPAAVPLYGAILVDGGSTVTIEETLFRGNRAQFGGGLAVAGRASVTVVGGRFWGNTATVQGGAIVVVGGGRLLLDGVAVERNRSALDGGGLTVADAEATVVNSVFARNTAARDAGGVNLPQSSRLTLRRSTVEENLAGRFAAGVAVQYGSQALLEGNVIRNNRVLNTDPDPSGGTSGGVKVFGAQARATLRFNRIEGNHARDGAGVYVELGAAATLVGNEIVGNVAAEHGGGVVVNDGSTVVAEHNIIARNQAGVSGGGLFVLGRSTINLRGNLVSANRTPGSGGGMVVSQDGGSAIEHNFFVANQAGQHGGGLLLDSTAAQVAHNRFRQNVAGGIGGGVLLQSQVTSVLVNNAVQRNRSGEAGDGVAVYFSAPSLIGNMVMDNDAAGRGDGIYLFQSTVRHLTSNLILYNGYGLHASGSQITQAYSKNNLYGNRLADYQGIAPGPGDLSADPLFVEGTYFLSHVEAGQERTSPLVDAGFTTAQALGLAEMSTRSDGAPDQGPVDIGFHYHVQRALSSSGRRVFLPVVSLSVDGG
ncbi:MAG: right-handed parallel beta-helix repeat-containing protein [Caldilineales bacterium]|nr:right-handed parallel beta-helix repeat-containing protein [Caldilineales bacterium]MDW8317673.1 NosD domain-containing protein [Anaerolineae bacterium]